MAEYLIQDTTLTEIAAAIRAKEGSTGAILVSDFANRISAISTGVTVQRKTGTFNTDSSGNATVNCGFKPDLVYISLGESDDVNLFSASAAFAEEKRSGALNIVMWTISEVTGGSTRLEDISIFQKTNGFSTVIGYRELSDGTLGPTSKKFNYTAVKYT